MHVNVWQKVHIEQIVLCDAHAYDVPTMTKCGNTYIHTLSLNVNNITIYIFECQGISMMNVKL